MALSVASPQPRLDLSAHREAMSLELPALVERLTKMIGKKLTAYIGSVTDTRAVDRWISGTAPYKEAEDRLRLAYHVTRMLTEYCGTRVVQAWFTGLNPELGDRAPARMLREGDLQEDGPKVLDAARSFVAGG